MAKYDPPKDWNQRVEYDKQWEREKAKADQSAGKYDPPRPRLGDDVDRKEKTWAEKDEYDKQWEREKAKDDFKTS